MLEITDVRVKKAGNSSKVKANVSVTFYGAFVVHDIKIVEGQNGLFVAMPSRKTPEGSFVDVAHPITSEARQLIMDTVLEKYRNLA